jgi:hypothetical protein
VPEVRVPVHRVHPVGKEEETMDGVVVVRKRFNAGWDPESGLASELNGYDTLEEMVAGEPDLIGSFREERDGKVRYRDPRTLAEVKVQVDLINSEGNYFQYNVVVVEL